MGGRGASSSRSGAGSGNGSGSGNGGEDGFLGTIEQEYAKYVSVGAHSLDDIGPITNGSEKQIKWASEIRDKTISDLKSQYSKIIKITDGNLSSNGMNAKHWRVFTNVFSKYREIVSSHSAGWWIDNRVMASNVIVNEAMEKAGYGHRLPD